MPLPTGRALLDPEKILREAGLSAGQTYVDFGCGTLGHFVIPAAGLVGEKGRVYALDVLKSALSAVEERARAEKILNLETVWGDLTHEKGTEKIPVGSIDLVSLINITGPLLKNQTVIINIKRALKDKGRLLVVDWRPGSLLANYMATEKVEPAELQKILEANGFRLLKSFAAGKNHFGLLFVYG